ncbi:MAG: hypothetical protein ABIY55_34150 [Kofleriaceae bacterium]
MLQLSRVHRLVCAAVELGCASAIACGGKNADAPGIDATDEESADVVIKTFPEDPLPDGRTENAMLVAFQDGDGPWAELSGVAGVYHARTVSPRYAFAVGCVSNPRSTVDLYYQTTSDTREVQAVGCPSPIETTHLSIDLQGVQPKDVGEVWVGRTGASALGGGAIRLDAIRLDAYQETADVFARSFSTTHGQDTNDVKTYRGPTLNLQTDQALAIDMAASKGIEFHPLAITNLAGISSDSVSVRSSYFTTGSYTLWPLHFTGVVDPSTTPVDKYATLDMTMRRPADVSNVSVSAFTSTTSGIDYARFASLALQGAGSQQIDLPDIVHAEPPVHLSSSSVRFCPDSKRRGVERAHRQDSVAPRRLRS